MIYKVELKDKTKGVVTIDAATIAITDGGVLGFVNNDGFIIRAFGEKEWKEVWLDDTPAEEEAEAEVAEVITDDEAA